MKRKLLTIIVGILLGLLLTFSPGFLFIFFLVSVLVLLFGAYFKQDDRIFIKRLFISGIILRIALLLLIQGIYISQNKWSYMFTDRVIAFMGDSAFYTLRSWAITQHKTDKLTEEEVHEYKIDNLSEYGHSGHTYLLVLFYYLFGFSPISVTFINSIFGVLTGIIYYVIAKEIANIKVAKITAVLVVFFPSLVLWSITNLKEPVFIFLTGLILWLFLQLLKDFRIRYLFFLLLTLLFQFSLRRFILVPTLLAGILCYLILKKYPKIILLPFFIIIFLCTRPILKTIIDRVKELLVGYHIGVISTGGFIYRIYDDWLYNATLVNPGQVSYLDLFRGLLKGWIHYFLEPFPWKVRSPLSLISMPQMIIWYFVLFFSMIGILIKLRYDWRKNLVFLLYILIIGSTISLTGGNIGTDFRMRDVLTPIFLLFSSVGLGYLKFFK